MVLMANVTTSIMSVESRVLPRFPWDYDIPDIPFWNDLGPIAFKVGRSFLSCYTTPEVSQMNLDPKLSQDEKLRYLRSQLEHTFVAKGGSRLHDADYKAWRNLKAAISTMDHYLGNHAEVEKIGREMYENGPNGKKDMSVLHALSAAYEVSGQYTEAEAAAKEALPWLQRQSGTNDSPQALGSMKVLMKSIWKQRRFDEANEWAAKCRVTIDNLGQGPFAKYQHDERQNFEDEYHELILWK